MKKIITIAVLAICLYSCEGFKQKNKNNKVTEDRFEYSGGSWSSLEYKIVEKTIDSCEYIIIFGSQGRNIIHKANCHNQFHNRNKNN